MCRLLQNVVSVEDFDFVLFLSVQDLKWVVETWLLVIWFLMLYHNAQKNP